MAIKAGQLKERADYQAYILEMLREENGYQVRPSTAYDPGYGVNELHAVLAHLAFGILPPGTLDAGLDFSIVLVLWLDEMVVEVGAVGVHIRVAGIPLLFSFVVFLDGGGWSAFSFLKAHNGVRHHTKLLSLKWWVCGGRGLFHIPPCHVEPAAGKLL